MTPEKISQRAEWPPINPSIHPIFHPSPACWISTQLDSRERARLQQTHGWINTQLYNRERALAGDARLKPENQCASRLDAGFVRKQRGSEQAGRQAEFATLRDRERERERSSLARWSKHRAAAAAAANAKTNCTQFLQKASCKAQLSTQPASGKASLPACLLPSLVCLAKS
jgi:hypothetical protein